MPAKYEMTWDGGNRRWRKFYRGTPYVVSCRQLGVPGTKEASAQAANHWWRRKRAGLDSGGERSAILSSHLDLVEKRRDWARSHGEMDEAEFLSSYLAN